MSKVEKGDTWVGLEIMVKLSSALGMQSNCNLTGVFARFKLARCSGKFKKLLRQYGSAHVKASSADEVLRSHYRFQIRTFWIGLLYLVLGWLLVYVSIGILILFWWLVWSMVRTLIAGALGRNAPDGGPISPMSDRSRARTPLSP